MRSELAVEVWERHSYWTRALRRYLPNEVSVSTRTPMAWAPDVPTRCAASSIVAIWHVEEETLEALLSFLATPSSATGTCLNLAVMEAEVASWGPLLGELGVSFWWSGLAYVPAICRLIERFSASHVVPDLSLEQRIWKNLPWHEFASDRPVPMP